MADIIDLEVMPLQPCPICKDGSLMTKIHPLWERSGVNEDDGEAFKSKSFCNNCGFTATFASPALRAAMYEEVQNHSKARRKTLLKEHKDRILKEGLKRKASHAASNFIHDLP